MSYGIYRVGQSQPAQVEPTLAKAKAAAQRLADNYQASFKIEKIDTSQSSNSMSPTQIAARKRAVARTNETAKQKWEDGANKFFQKNYGVTPVLHSSGFTDGMKRRSPTAAEQRKANEATKRHKTRRDSSDDADGSTYFITATDSRYGKVRMTETASRASALAWIRKFKHMHPYSSKFVITKEAPGVWERTYGHDD